MKANTSQNFLNVLIKLIEFILVLIVILDCNSVYRLRYGWSVDPQLLAVWAANVLAYILIILWIIKDKANLLFIKEYLAVIVISFLVISEYNAYFVNVGKVFMGYFFFFMTAMIMLFRIYSKNQQSFRLLYLMEYVMLFIAVTSVILWFGSSVLELWGRNSDIEVFWGGIYYDANYLNLCIRRWCFVGDLTKNLGIFVEPPMFGLFLGFGLYTEIFLKKKSNAVIVFIFLIALISCRAILAIMLAILALVFLFFEYIWNRKFAKVLIPCICIIALLGIIGLTIYKMHTGWGSFATHIDDFVAALKCWLENPILGCGYDCEMPIQEYMSDFRADNLGLSNSAAVVLAEGGIVLFAYYFIPFLIMLLAFFKGNHKLAYWAAGMFLFWVVVIFHTRLFIFFMLALGYSMMDLRIRLIHLKEDERREQFRVIYPRSNILDEKGFFSNKFLDLSFGFLVMAYLILACIAGYGIIKVNVFPRDTLLIAVFILLAEMGFVILSIYRKKLSKRLMSIIIMALWGAFMIIGHLYQVMDSMYTELHLHIQDSKWSFIVTVIVLYAIGLVVQEIRFNYDGEDEGREWLVPSKDS